MKYMQVQVGDFQKTEVTQVGYPAPAIHTTTTLLCQGMYWQDILG
jgi:hypothetical protein